MNPNVARTLLGAFAVLSMGCDEYHSNMLSRTTLLRAGFETGEGYAANRELVGQNGWTFGYWPKPFGSAGQGVSGFPFPGSPQCAYIGGLPGSMEDGAYVGLSHLVPPAPGAASGDIVEFSCRQLITDSTNGARNYFEWVFYDRTTLLCGLVFDNSNLEISRRRPDNSMHSSGVKFVRGEIEKVTVTLDFKRNLWSVAIGSKRLPMERMTYDGLPHRLARIAPIWWSGQWQAAYPGGPVAGDNRMIFDDVLVSCFPSKR